MDAPPGEYSVDNENGREVTHLKGENDQPITSIVRAVAQAGNTENTESGSIHRERDLDALRELLLSMDPGDFSPSPGSRRSDSPLIRSESGGYAVEVNGDLRSNGHDGLAVLRDACSTPTSSGTSSPRHTDFTLVDDAFAAIEDWLEEDVLHSISDQVVVAQLDEILLLLIAVRDGACGKELLQDVRRLFGTDLSPGTVYPHLNDLADEGALEVMELPKRKIHKISDIRVLSDRVEPVVDQLVVFSLVLKALTVDWNVHHSHSQEGETNE